jgi:hypothetical protein
VHPLAVEEVGGAGHQPGALASRVL